MIALIAPSGSLGRSSSAEAPRFTTRSTQNADPLDMSGVTSHRSEPSTNAAYSGSTFSCRQSAMTRTSFCGANRPCDSAR